MPDIEIHWDHLEEVSEAQKADAEARLRALATQHDDLLSLRVSGRYSAHHRRGDREVRIVGKAKGRDLFVSRSCPELSRALHDAVDAFDHEARNTAGASFEEEREPDGENRWNEQEAVLVEREVRELLDAVQGQRRIIVSCGGGMPPGVPTCNIEALVDAVAAYAGQAHAAVHS